MEIVKVSSKSTPKAVAGAIASIIREGKSAEIQAIGAGAVNQALKSVAIASAYVAEEEIEIICKPSFSETEINGEMRTAIFMLVEKR